MRVSPLIVLLACFAAVAFSQFTVVVPNIMTVSYGGGLIAITNGETITVELDTSVAPTLGSDNTWGGFQDFSQARFRNPDQVGLPDPAECTAATVGEERIDTTPPAGPTDPVFSKWFCVQPGAGTYQWVKAIPIEVVP